MAKTRLSKAVYVERGYGQVEPNHLSGQRTGQIYDQLPAAANIDMLENGQFAKYDYANGEVNFTGRGEWMLVFNEVKVYDKFLGDQDFAMIKDNYSARVYSPSNEEMTYKQSRYYGGVDAEGNSIEKVTAPANEYTLDSTENPFATVESYAPKMMADGTTMVPRLVKTNVGDIFTTNTVNLETLAAGDLLTPGEDGYLTAAGDDADMVWEVSKVYTLADRNKAVKIRRVA